MIKPGTNLCRVCGWTSDVHFYRSGAIGEGAKLEWDPDKKEFALHPYRGKYRKDLTVPLRSFRLVEPERYVDDRYPPDHVLAYIDDEQEPTLMSRCCPECDGIEVFPPDMGRLPCFIIAVIGAVSAGKTAWLGALTNALDALLKQSYPYRIEPWVRRDREQYAKSTHDYESGNTNYFLIKNAKTGENVAMVYLLDYAGELYKNQQINPGTPLGRILLGQAGKGYPGLDAAVFIEPAVDDRLNKDREGTEEVLRVISRLKLVLKEIPVARVCTFADKLIDKVSEEEGCGITTQIPRLSRKTFRQPVYENAASKNAETNKKLRQFYEPEAVVKRIRLQDYIASNLDDCVVGSCLNEVLYNNKSYGHFLVQSCEHIESTDSEEDEEGRNDYRMQFNVADPLIWLLYKLRLFPLELMEGGDW